MLNSNLCDYSDAYMHVKGTIAIPNMVTTNNANKKVIIKNCTPFINCKSKLNNMQIDDTLRSMYNLGECSNIYSKTRGSLCQNYRDEPVLNNVGNYWFCC